QRGRVYRIAEPASLLNPQFAISRLARALASRSPGSVPRRPKGRDRLCNQARAETTATWRNGTVRCAIYTRKSSEEGLEQEFNSLQAQREACEVFIESQRQEGWVCLRTAYDDGGFSGATMERPALQQLLADLTAGRVDTIVVYKI